MSKKQRTPFAKGTFKKKQKAFNEQAKKHQEEIKNIKIDKIINGFDQPYIFLKIMIRKLKSSTSWFL